MTKEMITHCNFLTSDTKTSADRMTVKAVLLDKCKPLTISQKTGNLFIARRFHFAKTIGAQIGAASYDMESDSWKSPLVGTCIDWWFGRHSAIDTTQQGSTNKEFITQCINMNEWIKDVLKLVFYIKHKEDNDLLCHLMLLYLELYNHQIACLRRRKNRWSLLKWTSQRPSTIQR